MNAPPPATSHRRLPDYSVEPPISRADRAVQRSRAAKFRYRPQHALTIECRDEADQRALFSELADRLQGRRIRVVIA